MANDGQITIQTLDEILAGMNKTKPAKSSLHQQKPQSKSIDKPASQPASIEQSLDGLDLTKMGNQALVQLLQQTPKEQLANLDRKENYLRWLAFYYLAKREHSQTELKEKLLAKGCEPVAVDELLQEFAKKGYQSDERTALMVVKEALRLGKGKRHIEQKLWQYRLDLPYTVDELIAMSGAGLDETLESKEIDWLKLAVEARCKKYGNTIPKDPKEKARQLRFLQYRGFEMAICFDALKMGLDDLVY